MTQDILHQIKEIKQGLLNKAFLSLLDHHLFKDWYRKFGRGSFSLFCYQCYRETEQLEQSAPMMQGNLIAQPIDKQYYSPEEYSQVIEKRVMIGKEMIQVDYNPPLFNDDIDLLLNHLHLMWHLYETGISWPPSIEGMCLDLSFAKLLSAAHRQIASDLIKGELNEPRTAKGAETRREKAESWKKLVMAIYEHGEPIALRTRLSEAIRLIQRQFEESKTSEIKKSGRENPKWGLIPDDIKTPERDSIKKLFKEERILDRDFEKKGRYWFRIL